MFSAERLDELPQPPPFVINVRQPSMIRPPSGAGAAAARLQVSTQLQAPDVVFVGAGPVGLWTAVQVKILCPDISVEMFEKHADYQRKHVLKLDRSSFKHAEALNHPELTALTKSLPHYVRTSELEEKLRALATSLGVRITIQNIPSLDELHRLRPSARVIIGSDGSHSLVRAEITRKLSPDKSDKDMSVVDSLQCILDVKYEVKEGAKKLRFLDQAYPTLKLMDFVADEHVGTRSADGITPVSLRLLVDHKTFSRCKDATFKNPYYPTTHPEQLGPKVIRSLTIWFNAKSQLCGEKRVPGSEKITALNLSVYCSKYLAAPHLEFSDKVPRHYFLVGDAAFGVPFFRALNNGLICGSKLAKAVAQLVDPSAQPPDSPVASPLESSSSMSSDYLQLRDDDVLGSLSSAFSSSSPAAASSTSKHRAQSRAEQMADEGIINKYVNSVQKLANSEIATARTKQAVLGLAQIARYVNSKVPWQIVFWSSNNKHRLQNTDPGFLPAHIMKARQEQAAGAATPSPKPSPRPASASVGSALDAPDATESKQGDDTSTVNRSPRPSDAGLSQLATFDCKMCGQNIPVVANIAGQCKHAGALHTEYSHCNAHCAAKLAMNGLGGPVNKLGMNHWSCCYAMAEQEWCPLSPPHCANSAVCLKCTRSFDPAHNIAGSCSHFGVWHDAYMQCGVKCAIKMSVTQYGHNHWSCCYATDRNAPCRKSPPHIAAPAAGEQKHLFTYFSAFPWLICFSFFFWSRLLFRSIGCVQSLSDAIRPCSQQRASMCSHR